MATMDDSTQHRNIEMLIIGHITTDIEDMRFLRSRNIGRDFFYYKHPAEDISLTQTLFDFAIGYYRDNDRLLSRDALIIELQKRGEVLKEGSIGARMVALLTKCQSMNRDKDSFPAILDRLREDAILRVLSNVTKLIGESSKTPSKAFESVYNYISNARIDLSEESSPTQMFNLSTGVQDIMDEYQFRKDNKDKIIGVNVGWPKLDEATMGFKKSTLNLIVGELGKGKSTVLLNWAAEANKQGKNVIFFSFEMPMWQVKARWVSRELRIPYDGFMHGSLEEEEEGRLREFYEKRLGGDEKFDEMLPKSGGYFIIIDQPDDKSSAFVEQMVKQCSSLYGPCDAIYVDYLGIMNEGSVGKGAQWWEHNGIAARGIRRIARIHNLVAFSAAQINREGLKYIHKQMENEDDLSTLTINPEHIEGWKEVSNTCDGILAFVPHDSLNQLHVFRVKGRDWFCTPFAVTFDPKTCYIGQIEDGFEKNAALFYDDEAMRASILSPEIEMDNIFGDDE